MGTILFVPVGLYNYDARTAAALGLTNTADGPIPPIPVASVEAGHLVERVSESQKALEGEYLRFQWE